MKKILIYLFAILFIFVFVLGFIFDTRISGALIAVTSIVVFLSAVIAYFKGFRQP